jgi:hypothetical protein
MGGARFGADVLGRRPSFVGRPPQSEVLLAGCAAAAVSGPDGVVVAQALAREINRTVWAPTTRLIPLTGRSAGIPYALAADAQGRPGTLLGFTPDGRVLDGLEAASDRVPELEAQAVLDDVVRPAAVTGPGSDTARMPHHSSAAAEPVSPIPDRPRSWLLNVATPGPAYTFSLEDAASALGWSRQLAAMRQPDVAWPIVEEFGDALVAHINARMQADGVDRAAVTLRTGSTALVMAGLSIAQRVADNLQTRTLLYEPNRTAPYSVCSRSTVDR